jgi:exopolyphosphatase/pppGpp-phosphohydrolase
VVLSTLVEHLGLQRLVVSDWGLREGAVFGALSLQPELTTGSENPVNAIA